MRKLGQEIDLDNMQMELGKTYEIVYTIPDNELLDINTLRKTLAKIETNLINSPDFQRIHSRLAGNKYYLTVKLKKPQETVAGLGILPLIAFGLYVAGAVVITALLKYGLSYSVTAIKEVSAPAIALTQAILPLALIAGLIVFAPHIAMLLPSRKK
jgi:hypothetical protein